MIAPEYRKDSQYRAMLAQLGLTATPGKCLSGQNGPSNRKSCSVRAQGSGRGEEADSMFTSMMPGALIVKVDIHCFLNVRLM